VYVTRPYACVKVPSTVLAQLWQRGEAILFVPGVKQTMLLGGTPKGFMYGDEDRQCVEMAGCSPRTLVAVGVKDR
jgi:hypothetical protein